VTRERVGTVPLSSDFGEWDHLSDEDAEALIAFCAPEFFRVLRPGGALYLFTGDRLLPSWWLALKRAGFALPRPYLLAWVKPNPAPSVRKRGWRSALEPIVYALKPGPGHVQLPRRRGDDERAHVRLAQRWGSRPPDPEDDARLIVRRATRS